VKDIHPVLCIFGHPFFWRNAKTSRIYSEYMHVASENEDEISLSKLLDFFEDVPNLFTCKTSFIEILQVNYEEIFKIVDLAKI
jgi:hypothetical protein